MKILGIQEYGPDASAALVENNKVLFAAEEERFNRIKHYAGFSFNGDAPTNSIDFCSSKGHDKIANGWNMKPKDTFNLLIRGAINNITNRGSRHAQAYSIKNTLLGHSIGLLRRKFFLNKLGSNMINHHRAHAAFARVSGFKKANVIVVDGAGERESISLFSYNNNQIELIKSFDFKSSLGQLYEYVTYLLGLGFFGEGKTMALSSFGKYNEKFNDLIRIDKNKAEIKINWKKAKKLNKFSRNEPEPITAIHKDIAFMLQYQLEKTVEFLKDYLYNKTGYKNLCVSGGVALNCKMNSFLFNSDNVKEIYVPSAPHDGGVSLGAAIELTSKESYPLEKLTSAYHGPSFNNQYIKEFMDNNKIKYEILENVESEAAHLISKGNIIGWFQGNMEFGPRALGNRSILSDPTNPQIKDRVNKTKHRYLWQPLAPAILEEKQSKYFEEKQSSHFMSFALKIKEKKKDEIPSVCHIDKTARIQTVSKTTNPIFYKLISEFNKVSGTPIILNTSFNSKGVPIVCTPQDAYSEFRKMGLDCLIMNNFLIRKN
jgi:carbamoyltransferase